MQKFLDIFILGILNCLTFTLTQVPMALFLSDLGYHKIYITMLPFLTSSYALRFLWDGLFKKVPIPYLEQKLGIHRSWILIISLSLNLVCFLFLICTVKTFVFPFIIVLSFLGASQTNIIDSYRIHIRKTTINAQTTAYLYGYRGAKILTGSLILYLISYFADWGMFYSYRLAYCMFALLIFICSLLFINSGQKTSVYKTELSIFEFKKLYLTVKETQGLYIFVLVILFRFPDTALSNWFNIYFASIDISKEIISMITFCSLLFSLLGLQLSYVCLKKVKITYAMLLAALLQSLSILPFVIETNNILYITLSFITYKIIGCFSVCVIANYMRINCDLSGDMSQSVFIFSESVYRLVSILAGFFGGLLATMLPWDLYFASCFLMSMIPLYMMLKNIKLPFMNNKIQCNEQRNLS